MRLIDGSGVKGVLVNRGQHDTNKFKLSETIRYTPTEVQQIIDEEMVCFDHYDMCLLILRHIRESLWEDAKNFLNAALTEEVPILISNSEADHIYQEKVKKIKTLGEAIHVLEDIQKEKH